MRRAGFLLLLMACVGCASVNTQTARQVAAQGCCEDVYISGICQPNPAVPQILQCVPQKPQGMSCVRDPFRCDKLQSAPVDNCVTRNRFKGLNAPCVIQLGHTTWDPNAVCVKNQCSLPVPVRSNP